ncbi:MAG: hypothetical protein NVSMB42_16140 [Herpetosiphon sp.]
MDALTSRPYRDDRDLESICKLLAARDARDKSDENPGYARLHVRATQDADRARNIRLWTSQDGTLHGFGWLYIPRPADVVDAFLWFAVASSAYGGALESRILAWADKRTGEVSTEHGLPGLLRLGVRSDRDAELALLQEHGFQPVRSFVRMARSLRLPIDVPVVPPGFTLRPLNGVGEAQAWVELFNQSFIDHYNFHAATLEQRVAFFVAPYYRAELDLVVTAPDGSFVALCFAEINDEQNNLHHRSIGKICDLGTRRGFRRRGLARASLLAGLQRLAKAGMQTAWLFVDAQNPTGAIHLYEATGFKPDVTVITMVRAHDPEQTLKGHAYAG